MLQSAQAMTLSKIEVGKIVRYDRLGPWDTIGTVVSVDHSAEKVELRKADGNTKYYAARKIKSPLY
jgi:hypothetical protein